jgi:predicted Zn-dependent peptidase
MKLQSRKMHKNTHYTLTIIGSNESEVNALADVIDENRLDYNMDYLDFFQEDGSFHAEFCCHRSHKDKAIDFINREISKFKKSK